MSKVRRLASRVSMILGAGLFVAGLAMRAGVLGSVHAAVGPTPGSPGASGPAAVALATATPTAALVPSPVPPASQPAPTLSPTASPMPTPTPGASGELLFADDFDVEAAWPTGKVTGGKAHYAGGWYVLALTPIDLPGYVYPAAGDGTLPPTLAIEATLALVGGDVRAGPFVADANGTKIGILISADGRVFIVRDSVESFETLGSGSTTLLSDSPVVVTLSIGPGGTTALVDGHPVATVHERLSVTSFGLIAWSQTAAGTVKVDHFEARAPGP